MGEIKVRNLPDKVILELDKLAREKSLSRESFLRKELIGMIQAKRMEAELRRVEKEIYSQLLPTFERNNELIQELLNRF